MKTLFKYVIGLCAIVLGSWQDANATDITLSLSGVANTNYAGILPGFSSGDVLLGGVNFNIPSSYPMFNTTTDQSVLSGTISTDIANANDVCLLLNTGNTYSDEMSVGDQIGQVVLLFSSGTNEVIPLDVGVNIREWAVGTTAQSVINTTTSPSVQEVWSGDNNGGIESVVDMLTIPVTGTGSLTGIVVQDQSEAEIGQTDPTLILRGATVQAVPEPSNLAIMGVIILTIVAFRPKLMDLSFEAEANAA